MLLPPTHGAGKELGSGECKNRAGLKVLSFVGSHIPQDVREPGNVHTPVPEGLLWSPSEGLALDQEQQGPPSHMAAPSCLPCCS